MAIFVNNVVSNDNLNVWPVNKFEDNFVPKTLPEESYAIIIAWNLNILYSWLVKAEYGLTKVLLFT